MYMNNNAADPNDWVLGCIHGYYVKYERLIQLVNFHFRGSDAHYIDLFIDMTDIMRKLNNFLSSQQGIVNNGLVVASGIINMVAHYRYFFRTRYRCDTRIWIIASIDNKQAPLQFNEFVPAMKSLNKVTQELYTNNLDLLNIICRGIGNVQLEICNCDFATKVMQIRSYEYNTSPAICISKDPFTFQFCGSQDPYPYVLVPIKHKGIDDSIIVTRENAVDEYIRAISSGKTDQNIHSCVDSQHLSVFMGLTRVPTRSIKTMYTVPTALKIIKNADHGYPYDLSYFIDTLVSRTGGKLKNPYELMARIRACDTCYLQLAGYKSSPEASMYTGIVNIYDPAGVQQINNQYFSKYPLDLNAL